MRPILALTLCLAMSACSESDLYVKSSFKSPSSSGNFSGIDDVYRSGQDTNALGGYAYVLGDSGGSGFRAHAGLLPGTSVAPPPTTGIATMSGRYELGQITGINIGYTSISGFGSSRSGAITLTADFDKQTLTGSSGLFSVDGSFSGSDLGGTVSYGTADAKLGGVVGATAAVGVFQGRTDTSLIAGGFAVD